MQSGIIASTIANVNRGKGSKPFTFNDFIPRFKVVGMKQKAEEQKGIIETLASAWGALRGKKGKEVLKKQRRERRLQKLRKKKEN